MEALASTLGAGLGAVSGLALVLSPPATAGAAGPNPAFSEDTLCMLLHNLLSGDSRLQQQMLERYYSSSARFTLNGGLITLGDRGSLGQLLHGLQLAVGVEPEVLEIISSPNKAVALLNLYLTYRFAPWTWSYYTRVQVPTTITLTFGPSPDVLLTSVADDVVVEHSQELSLPDLLWWNPAWLWFKARLWGPLSGRLLSGFVALTASRPLAEGSPVAAAAAAAAPAGPEGLAQSEPDDAAQGVYSTGVAAAGADTVGAAGGSMPPLNKLTAAAAPGERDVGPATPAAVAAAPLINTAG